MLVIGIKFNIIKFMRPKFNITLKFSKENFCVLFVRAQRTSNLFSDQMSGRDLVPPIGASVTTSASRHGVNPEVGLHGDREAQSVPGDIEDFFRRDIMP